MLIDSHAHLDSECYSGDLEAVLRRARQAGVSGILAIGIGEGPSEMHQAREIVRRFSGREDLPEMWASAGIYPHATEMADEAALARLDEMLGCDEVIACGEIGLDYYHDGAAHAVQARAFVAQMEIAARHRAPILIHCRPAETSDDCWVDLLRLMGEHWAATGVGGVLHCFSGTPEQAQAAMEMGFLISFAGQVTYPKMAALRAVAAEVPLNRLLVETDAPYLAPGALRGQRNEPGYVALTAGTLAEVKGCAVEELAQATTENFQRLFAHKLARGVGN